MAKEYYSNPKTDPFQADSTPLLDGWGWAEFWICSDWMAWHKANKNKYGKEIADEKFMKNWAKQDSTANPNNWCKYDSSFSDYIKREFPDERQNVFSAVVTTVGSLGQGVSNIGSSVESATKVFKIMVPILVGVAIIGIGVIGYNKYIK